MEPRDLNEYRLLLAAAELRMDSLIEDGAVLVAELEAYKLENAKAHRQLLEYQKIIVRMERQVNQLHEMLGAAEMDLRNIQSPKLP